LENSINWNGSGDSCVFRRTPPCWDLSEPPVSYRLEVRKPMGFSIESSGTSSFDIP
jgi:hypothetical protein